MPASVAASNVASELAEVASDVLVRTLASLNEPATLLTLRQKLSGPYKLPEAELERQLESLIEQGVVHRFSPYKSKANRYWNRSPREYAEQLLTTQIADLFETKNGVVARFKAKLRDLPAKEFDQLLQQLVRSGKLHTGKFLGGQAVRYSARPFDAQVLLDNAIEQIAQRFSTSPAQVRALIAQSNQPPVQAAETSHDSFVIDAIAELRPGSGGGTIVPIAELRRFLEFKLDRDSFDAALRAMERDGRIDFTVHPDSGTLDEASRRERLAGEGGKIYDMLIVRR